MSDIHAIHLALKARIPGLTETQATILAVLVGQGGQASVDDIWRAVYGVQIRAPGVVKVHVCHLRKKLPRGVVIGTLRGTGYVLSPSSMAVLQTMLAAVEKGEAAAA